MPEDRRDYTFETKPPQVVRDYFETKGLKPAFNWGDVWQEEHATAFTVAKLMELTVLGDVRDSLVKALDHGQTFESWKIDIQATLEKRGWAGPREVTDPETGEVRETDLTSPRRLRTIFETNMRSARAAGQWERAQRTKRALPFFIYTLGPSEIHRPHHADKEGIVLPVDHPFWKEWFAPNGWGCKCRLRQVTEAQARAAGWTPDYQPPAVQRVAYRNRRTGEVSTLPLGIDPGFAWSPGQGRFDSVARLLKDRLDTDDAGMVRSATTDLTRWPMFQRFATGKVEGWVPVAVAPPRILAELGVDVRTVQVSQATMEKQARKHPEMNPRAYHWFQQGMETGTIIPQTNGRIRLVWQADNVWWRAILKRNSAGTELILISMHRLSEDKVARNLRP